MTLPFKSKINSVTISFDASIGMRVRTYRLLLDMTQSDLANELGVSFQQIQKYENGINKISPEKLQKIATIFGADVSVFFNDEHHKKFVALLAVESTKSSHTSTAPEQSVVVNLTPKTSRTPDANEILELFGKIKNDNLKEHIIRMIRELAEKDGQ